MTEEYRNLCQRTLDNLKEAQLHLQRAQSHIKAAKSFNAISGNERKLLDKVYMSLYEPYDNIQCVIEAIRIMLK